MTRKRLDQIVDSILVAAANAHGMNCTPEAKGGDLGDVMALVGRVLGKATVKWAVVAATGGALPEGVPADQLADLEGTEPA